MRGELFAELASTANKIGGDVRVHELPADLAAAWKVTVGSVDPNRDLLEDFIGAGWTTRTCFSR